MRTIVICGDDAATRLVARSSFASESSHLVDVPPRQLPQVLAAFRVHVLVVLGDATLPVPLGPIVDIDVRHVSDREAARACTIVDVTCATCR